MQAMTVLPLRGGKHLSPASAGRILVPPRAVPKTTQAIQWLVQELALVGLLAGILLLALPGTLGAWPPADLPIPVTYQTTDSPRVMMLGAGVSLAMSPSEENHLAVITHRRSLFRDNLRLDDGDLDDDPSPMVVLPPGNRVFPPSLTVMRMNDGTDAFSWPFRYLVRPQLLTRLSPLR
jgi:hypothetical protein